MYNNWQKKDGLEFRYQVTNQGNPLYKHIYFKVQIKHNGPMSAILISMDYNHKKISVGKTAGITIDIPEVVTYDINIMRDNKTGHTQLCSFRIDLTSEFLPICSMNSIFPNELTDEELILITINKYWGTKSRYITNERGDEFLFEELKDMGRLEWIETEEVEANKEAEWWGF